MRLLLLSVYIFVYPKQRTLPFSTEQGLPWYWFAWSRMYVHNPRAQDQLPPGSRAECFIWDLPSPTNLLYWQELSCQRNRQQKHKSCLAERTPCLRKAVWPLFLPWRIPCLGKTSTRNGCLHVRVLSPLYFLNILTGYFFFPHPIGFYGGKRGEKEVITWFCLKFHSSFNTDEFYKKTVWEKI